MPINYENTIMLVHFLVKDVRMCAYLKDVEKILPLVALENVPGSPSYLVGLMNIKGKMIPVIDFATRIGIDRHENFLIDTPVLLLSNGKQQIAVIVDNVFGLTELNKTDLQMNNDFKKPNSPFLATVINDLDSSLLIDINYLMKSDLINGDNLYASKNEN